MLEALQASATASPVAMWRDWMFVFDGRSETQRDEQHRVVGLPADAVVYPHVIQLGGAPILKLHADARRDVIPDDG